MTKTLDKTKSKLVAEYAYYVGRHAEYEQAVMRASLDKNSQALKDCLLKAQWAAKSAMTAARCLGLADDFVSTAVKQRAAA